MHTNRVSEWPEVPIGAFRIWDNGANWYKLCPTGPTCDFAPLHEAIDAATANGIDDIEYTFGHTPTWASSNPGDTTCGIDPGGCWPPPDLNADGTGTDQTFKDFVTAIANEAGTKITSWEVWNEPMNKKSWRGTVAQMVRMTNDTAQIIKSINPNAKIVMPTPGGTNTNVATWLDGFFAAGGGAHIDIVAYHSYEDPWNGLAEQVVGQSKAIHDIMATYGLESLPLWSTEGGWGTDNHIADLPARAAFLARSYVLHWSSGVERFYWYSWDNAGFGTLWDPATGIQPAGTAYKEVQAWLVGAVMTAPCSKAADATYTCHLTRSGGYEALVVFNPSGTVSFSAPSQYGQYKDLSGGISSLPTDNSVSVGPSPIMLETVPATPAPTVTLTPTSAAFADVTIGRTSAAEAIKVSNTGDATLNINGIHVIGTDAADFAQTDDCGATLAASANCTVQVTFSPSAGGTRSASLSLADDANGSPQSVALTGNGVDPAAPAVTLSVSTLTFPQQDINTTSPAKNLNVTNSGNGPLSVTGVAISGANGGDFAQTNDCGTSVAVGASCTIAVTFAPTTTGTKAGTLTITDDSSDSPQKVAMTGEGVLAAAPEASLAPTSVSFADQNLNTTSAAISVTLTNTGNASLSISGISIAGTNAADFAQTSNCGASLAASAQCTISVRFTPTATGTRAATVRITDNADTSPQTVSLTGTGTAPPVAVVSLSATSVTFANQQVGSTSAPRAITLTNTGNAALSITSLAVAGANAADFAQTNTCGSSVAAGANCTISVTFTPSSTGTSTAAVKITNNAADSPQTVTLTGTGTAPPAPVVSLSATSVTFANQQVGSTSAPRAITLTNTGNAALSITSLAVAGANAADFAQTNTCGSGLAAGANCTISVSFSPKAAGTRNASVTIADNASGSPHSITLGGSGIGVPTASLTPTSSTFAAQVIGSVSVAKGLTLLNSGSAPLTVTAIAITGTNPGDFTQTNNCGTSVAAGASCTIQVLFAPKAAGTRSAVVSITDNAAGSPHKSTLTGTATAPVAGLTPTNMSFGPIKVGTASATKTVTVSNTGNGALLIKTISITGTNPSAFLIATTGTPCGSSLSPGSTCTVAVYFKPTTTGTKSAALTITDNATNSPQKVSLSGTGK